MRRLDRREKRVRRNYHHNSWSGNTKSGWNREPIGAAKQSNTAKFTNTTIFANTDPNTASPSPTTASPSPAIPHSGSCCHNP
jgi:hypothetical protein